jgi:hypothetical protein
VLSSGYWVELLGARVEYVGSRYRTRIMEAGSGEPPLLLHPQLPGGAISLDGRLGQHRLKIMKVTLGQRRARTALDYETTLFMRNSCGVFSLKAARAHG